jgi:hypothetical protein
MWQVMQEDVAGELKIEDEGMLRHLHLANQEVLEPTLYPHAQAVYNAFQLAIMEEPEVATRINPTSLWDIHLLRTIDESGYISELYGGEVPPPGRIRMRSERAAVAAGG